MKFPMGMYLIIFVVSFVISYIAMYFILTKNKSEPTPKDHIYSAFFGLFIGAIVTAGYRYFFYNKKSNLLKGNFYGETNLKNY